ncbi:PilC/PilY family type IV pilus protein [Ramlibacter humi]|uniref:PilY1 beta-propeller domain-containing protein n=1 Tax=Ramlibacter humi TaxID=2530451 RepID=A0A4Z0CAN9_9BURK|nr:PilC/PilY family type IV pilus protein [Ramlibacter humi]TFZ08727.1 hypothetical protein EZ216_06160 [Ramlibacter humi]
MLKRSTLLRATLGVLLTAFAGLAAATDIATAPLFTSSANQVKPNLMFILDDSGSMAWDYLPDPANFSSTKYGKKSYQCNGVAYNPNVVYTPPKNADGTTQANASQSVITSLSNPTTQTSNQRTISGTVTMPTTLDGTMTFTITGTSFTTTTYQPEQAVTIFQSGDSNRFFTGEVVSWTRTSSTAGTLVVDISVGFMEGTGSFSSPRIGGGVPSSPTYYRYTGTQKALGYTYNSSGVITNTTFYSECNSAVGSTPGSSVFTAVSVTASSTEAQNYANWYTFYRTRILMMQSSASRAFANLDSRYRVGYTTINERSAASGANFLDIADFDATQKSSFYTKLFAASPGSNTPLRGALSKAGQYYAKKASGQTVDPIQYSCQRNYAILSTDGYWNTGSESTTAGALYGPYRLDNATTVGQQDGSGTARPMADGETSTRTITENWTITVVTTTTDVTPQLTTSTVTTSTTTLAPIRGQQNTTSDLLTRKNVGSSSFVRPSGGCAPNCVVTVNLTAHGFLAGDTVTITDTNGTSYGATGIAITVVNADRFTYVLSSRPGNPSGTYQVAIAGSASCPVGQGKVTRQWTQTSDVVGSSTFTSVTATSVTSVRTAVTTGTNTTPWTKTTTEIDGVAGTPTTSQGTSSNNPGTAVVTNTPGSTTVSTSTSTVSNGTTTTAWVRAASPSATVTLGSCTATTPADTTPVTVGTTTTTTRTPAGPTNAGPTVTNTALTASTPVVATSESAHVISTSAATVTGGASNTLADVAMYYYKTDLRDSTLNNCTGALNSDVCTNNVPGNADNAQHSGGDVAAWQHMTTFTLGLGVGGTLNFDPNYLTQTSGDFVNILNRTINWPLAGSGKSAENIDDLWHAAVNGRGQYFSAGDPTSLATALTGALEAIKAVTGTAAAASTSSLNPVQGDNDVFLAQFTSVKWTGDLLSFRIDPDLGTVSTTPVWSAKTQLDAKAPGTRTILYPNPSGGPTLRAFNTANLTTDNYIANFTNFCSKISAAAGSGAPQQCATLSAADTTSANSAANLVNFLRGDQTQGYYRSRDSVLGDIISASPLFVGKPAFKYTENNYQTYVTNNASRTAVVLSAANDGMLHAFDRTTGDERWAFMPSSVLPNLYKLADTAYGASHAFYVDGSPVMGDIYVSGGSSPGWKTIVIGGLNGGGRGYYALDVTDPANPKFLWEFSNKDDANLGLTFGNPIITKRADNTWVVVFTSGYNNNITNSGGTTGDGNGRLFVLNANTGQSILTLPTMYPDGTAAGNASTPSGLGKLNAWVDSVEENKAKRFYAGDLLGNVWRFDLDDLVPPSGREAFLLAQLTAPGGAAQSITTKPGMVEINYNGTPYPAVVVATGRYLGSSDLADTTVNSLYVIRDPLTASSLSWGTSGGIRATTSLVRQTMTVTTDANGVKGRDITNAAIDWGTKYGWYVDFPVGGERVSVDPEIVLNFVTIGSILPNNSACTVGGESFIYRLNTGDAKATTGVAGKYVGNVLIQGLTTVQLTNGSITTLTTTSKSEILTENQTAPVDPANLRRSSWRELTD